MSDAEREARRRRAAGRATWPGRISQLEDLPEVECIDGSASELVAMVMELTLASWAMSGRAMPDYDRAQMPGRVVRLPADE